MRPTLAVAICAKVSLRDACLLWLWLGYGIHDILYRTLPTATLHHPTVPLHPATTTDLPAAAYSNKHHMAPLHPHAHPPHPVSPVAIPNPRLDRGASLALVDFSFPASAVPKYHKLEFDHYDGKEDLLDWPNHCDTSWRRTRSIWSHTTLPASVTIGNLPCNTGMPSWTEFKDLCI